MPPGRRPAELHVGGPPSGNVPLVACPSVSTAHTDGASSSAAITAPAATIRTRGRRQPISVDPASTQTAISTGGSQLS